MNKYLFSIALLLLFAPIKGNTQPVDSLKSASKKQSLLDILVQEDLPKLAIEMDFKMLFDDRRMMNYQKAALSLTMDDGSIWTDKVNVKTRGKFRSLKCDNPPLKIKFPKKALKARGLNKLNEFKLVYPCKTQKAHQKFVLKEYLVYKLYNVLTDYSLRVQLVDLMLKDSMDHLPPITAKGFLIEHREELIARIDAKMSDIKCMKPIQLSNYDYTLFQVFEFFIGNTDWLLPTCKNAEVISLEDGTMIPIPYDFDFSGMVNADYAIPNSSLPVKYITDRYFLGHKKKMEDLVPVFEVFQNKKEALINTINTFEYLPKSERRIMVKYLQSFYKILGKPRLVKKVFIHPMGASMAKDY